MLAVLGRNGVYLTGFDLYSLALLMLESVATTPTSARAARRPRVSDEPFVAPTIQCLVTAHSPPPC
jgi:hypothetical protein